MTHKFIEVTSSHPTTGDVYNLMLQTGQIVQIQPELKVETEPKHEPLAVVVLSSGETLVLKNSYRSLVEKLSEINLLERV